MESGAAGLDEALLLNDRGNITEGSTSNVFMVKGKSLVTPPLGSGLLPGITREVVLELAPSLGLEVVEQDFTVEDIRRCDESFLTSSLIEIIPLVRVKNKTGKETVVRDSKPGEITKKLRAAYGQLVWRETGQRE
jgi:branched-chain amino acid aminotransferase